MCRKIEIFTDGSCISNPGPGGYGIILRNKIYIKELSAGYILTTNNRMELLATIIALENLRYSCQIIINTDSKYVYKGINQWIHIWKMYEWKNSKKRLIKNVDLWKRLNFYINFHKIQWNWIKSHSGYLENERCHQLARTAANNPIYYDIGYKIE